MTQKKKIAHIIFRDKFTSGYINFMELSMPEYEHVYITSARGFELELVDSADVIYINRLREWRSNGKLKDVLKNADEIIVSGLFGPEFGLTLFYPQYLKKTYLHFWGNDFYQLRYPVKSIRKKIYHWIKRYCVKHCRVWLNLIPGDYGELAKIAGIEKKHFVAPMPGDPRKKADFDKIMAETEPHEGCRIIVGNSATATNRHFEVFEMLRHLKDENIEIICPLSYGDKKYGQMVIEKGKEIFGDKFRALFDYMKIGDYIRLLASCDVGVFDQNRQQGMGNIGILLGLGKKVFLNTNTSMWTTFCEMGYKTFDVNALRDISAAELCKLSENHRSENIRVHRGIYNNRISNTRKRWLEVLND